jgi:hypothetical protein
MIKFYIIDVRKGLIMKDPTDRIMDFIIGGIVASILGLLVVLKVYDRADPVEISDTKCQYMASMEESYYSGKYIVHGSVGGFLCGQTMVSLRWEELDPGLFNNTKELHLIRTEMGPFFSRKIFDIKIFKDIK